MLNTHRYPAASYLVLHRSTCRTITGAPAGGSRWTSDYSKICGQRRDLEQLVLERLGAVVHPCKFVRTPLTVLGRCGGRRGERYPIATVA
ncbi:hypothetical protein [Solwaraspora sp. WMMA2065]|uniref:hypothetical protein n=1 Tax=Solwaraspora sp. WMMA2065 TaxID=3015166 RepID=UPI00259B0320|nr:hypothetical protein [Solwaraspora sp. WMMA2065]WJK36537.1 hypothetical protein O7610_09405 [Solwaraspora sp. WMMA2065]